MEGVRMATIRAGQKVIPSIMKGFYSKVCLHCRIIWLQKIKFSIII